MAAGLQAREMERRMQSSFLEAQVAERTRELSESNNRLQVEIAGREKTEAALHQAQKLQAVGQLAGGIAHDFNNMLATVLGNLELMERRVAGALTDLSDMERAAFVLRHYEGMCIDDISRTLGVQPNAAKHSVFRAVQKLRRALEPLVSTA